MRPWPDVVRPADRDSGGGSHRRGSARLGWAGYLSIPLLALAEEQLFRGLLAGLLIRRMGFLRGNTAQALIFLAPRCLLLLVSTALWPILPVQLIAGWLLGWLYDRSGSIGPGWLAHAGGLTI